MKKEGGEKGDKLHQNGDLPQNHISKVIYVNFFCCTMEIKISYQRLGGGEAK